MSVESDLDKKVTYGDADGPDLFMDQLGIIVPTFINPRNDLIPPKARAHKRVSHHIPFKMRGFFKPHEWPSEYRDTITWNTDKEGFVLCNAINKAGNECANKAVNRTQFCRNHGGGLHPLDKKITMQNVIEVPQERIAQLTRAQRFMQGFITTDELSDEEIQGMFIYEDDGQKVKSITLGIKIHQQIAQELHKRLNRFLQTKTASMLSVMVDIAESDLVEPADRIKAAQWVAERTLGKTPDIIIHGKTEQPYEAIFETIDAGSREDYRQKISSTRLELGGKPDTILDVETIEEPEDSDSGEDHQWHTRSESPNPDPGPTMGHPGHPGQDSDQRNPAEEITPGWVHNKEKHQEVDRQKEIKKARAKAKQRRFAARANGATTSHDLPWLVEWKFNATGKHAGCYTMLLVCPEDQTPARLDKVEKSNALALEQEQHWRNNGSQASSQPVEHGRAS